MRLTDLLVRGGKQMILAGGIAMLIGWLVVFLQSALSQQAILLNDVMQVLVMSGLLIAALHIYQRSVFWKRLHKQLLASPVQQEITTTRYPKLPMWGWVAWVVVIFMFAYGFTPIFAILSGSLLIGYASASSWLADKVRAVESGRVTFYTMLDQKTRRSNVVRTINDLPED